MPATGQFLLDAEGRRWWFDSGAAALDFAYTGIPHETLVTPAQLGAWLERRFPGIEGAVSENDLVDARGLRAAVARAVVATSRASAIEREDVDAINLYAALPDIPPSLEGGTVRAGRAHPRVSQALSALARETVTLLSATPHRIRRCAADDCGYVFYDESRSNNRRWCSMERCGNRAKVRAFRERRAAAEAPVSR